MTNSKTVTKEIVRKIKENQKRTLQETNEIIRLYYDEKKITYSEYHKRTRELKNEEYYYTSEKARETYLAYGFIRGKKYRDIERVTRSKPDYLRVAEYANAYPANILEWMEVE